MQHGPPSMLSGVAHWAFAGADVNHAVEAQARTVSRAERELDSEGKANPPGMEPTMLPAQETRGAAPSLGDARDPR